MTERERIARLLHESFLIWTAQHPEAVSASRLTTFDGLSDAYRQAYYHAADTLIADAARREQEASR